MPTYEYRREDGTTFEIWQKITDDALKTCPDTGQKVERLISPGAGLIFKGDGFYVTDYARNGNGSASSEKKSESNTSEKKSEKAESEA